jgi:hypothetical protein
MAEAQAPPAKKLKPARKQVKPGEVVKKEAEQTGKEYNIWYNKWAGGDREDSYSNKVKSQTRCRIKRDSGWTRADSTGMKYCCLFFSRGCCPYGHECQYLHRLPRPDMELPDNSKDCFAREKFADYRDDMGGVGSFSRQNFTLYVGRVREAGTAAETEEVIRRHFGEWGQIDRIRVLQHRSVAFVTYVSELQAQFAKEAMACQSLDNDEILNVRWATEDPNPTSKIAEHQRLVETGQAAITKKMDHRVVDAVRAIRALEDGDDLEAITAGDEADAPQSEPADERAQKRRKLDPEPAPPPPETQPESANGLLSADTLEGLRYLAEKRKMQQAAAPKPAAPVSGLGGIGNYGSDEDD